MVAGEMSGYCEMGRPNMLMIPSRVVAMAMTPAMMGCLMKNGDMVRYRLMVCCSVSAGVVVMDGTAGLVGT